MVVIDDDPSVRKALRRLLSLAGHEVDLVESADEYLRRTPPARPACLLLDMRMPGMGGLELQRHLAATPHDLPIVFITGHGDDPARAQALGAGAVAVIDKPVDAADLMAAVDAALRASLASE